MAPPHLTEQRPHFIQEVCSVTIQLSPPLGNEVVSCCSLAGTDAVFQKRMQRLVHASTQCAGAGRKCAGSVPRTFIHHDSDGRVNGTPHGALTEATAEDVQNPLMPEHIHLTILVTIVLIFAEDLLPRCGSFRQCPGHGIAYHMRCMT